MEESALAVTRFFTRLIMPIGMVAVVAGLLTIVKGLTAAPAKLRNTRFRAVGEGIATLAIAGISIATGFSIGFLFVPLVGLMIWLCIRQLRSPKPRAESDLPSG